MVGKSEEEEEPIVIYLTDPPPLDLPTYIFSSKRPASLRFPILFELARKIQISHFAPSLLQRMRTIH